MEAMHDEDQAESESSEDNEVKGVEHDQVKLYVGDLSISPQLNTNLIKELDVRQGVLEEGRRASCA